MNYRSDLSFSILFMFIGALICFMFVRGCSDPIPAILPHNTETIRTQTKWYASAPITITKVSEPRIVYVTKSSVSDQNKNWCDSVRFYTDTTQIDTSSYVVCLDSVMGVKKWSGIKYFGKPYYKEVIITKIDSIYVPVSIPKRELFVGGGAGIGPVNHLYLGLDYISRKRVGASYFYDLLQQSHNVFLKIKLF